MDKYILMIENYLNSLFSEKNKYDDKLQASMHYSLKAGGKRIRPGLLLEFCKICKGNINLVLPFACAVEIIHTYSLIHDDLPCMDNDDMRRGQKSNHIVFGESTALLAGDALQSLAFEIMLSDETVSFVGAQRAAKAAGALARQIGAPGMCGGQAIDLYFEGKKADIENITDIHNLKTGALISAACMMGVILAGESKEKVQLAKEYGEKIGLAFQIADDILDVTSTQEELGKPIGSDSENKKSTYATLLGVAESKKLVEKLTCEAVNILDCFGEDSQDLKEFTLKLSCRTK